MSLVNIFSKEKMGLVLFMLFLLLATNNIKFAMTMTEYEEMDGLIQQNYEKIYSLSQIGGDVSIYLSDINNVLDDLVETRNDPNNLLSEEEFLGLKVTLTNLQKTIDEEIIYTRSQNQVSNNKLILTRLFLVAGLFVFGFYLIVNPPRSVIGLKWFGEFDES